MKIWDSVYVCNRCNGERMGPLILKLISYKEKKTNEQFAQKFEKLIVKDPVGLPQWESYHCSCIN